MNRKEFEKWLENNTTVIPYTIGRYTGAIDTISSELSNYGISDETSLYNFSDVTKVDIILNNNNFKKKNNKGNRMYSGALKYFKGYINDVNEKDIQQELMKEEREFKEYLKEPPVKGQRTIVDKMHDKPNSKKVNNRKVWRRNPKNASDAITHANYLCEYENGHKHFISKYNNMNYVEAHHLIPMEFQDQFDCSIDVPANIVSLCSVCHNQIHYGLFEEKQEILDKLFKSRKDRLKKCGINIDIDNLYKFYQD